ncbi:MAG TPA: TetR family transcriptional regulator [Actinomycetales bacterium]|nr:TetR family transcriptional regulator [Actinomycetales bacterium]
MATAGGRRSSTPGGRQRRESLVAAAAVLLVEHGPAGVTARAVAASADTALGQVPYYFTDVRQMLRAASMRVLEAHLEAARDRMAGTTVRTSRPALARTLVAMVLGPYAGRGVDGVRAMYGRVLAASADPEWADDMRQWDERFGPMLVDLLTAAGRDATRPRALLACADGLAVSAALRGLAEPEAFLVAELADVLDLLAPQL